MIQRPVNRIEPKLPAAAYKTYELAAPVATHWRKASCADIDCPRYLNGWRVHVEQIGPELTHAAKTSGRRFQELRVAEGQTYLVFEAGQPCFQVSEHRKRVDRPELYVVRDGDWRGNPRRTEARRHSRPEHWVEDFAEHQDRLATARGEG
jgi:hypothetical protein